MAESSDETIDESQNGAETLFSPSLGFDNTPAPKTTGKRVQVPSSTIFSSDTEDELQEKQTVYSSKSSPDQSQEGQTAHSLKSSPSQSLSSAATTEDRIKWKEFEDELGRKIIETEGTISGSYRHKRCQRCIACRVSICDAKNKPSLSQLGSIVPCSLCVANGWSCTFQEYRKRQFNEVWNPRKYRKQITDLIPGVEWVKMWKSNESVALLPESLRIETSLLDGLHRAMSHHIQVYEEHNQVDHFETFDSQALIALAYLTEELVKDTLRGLFVADEERSLAKTPKIPEFSNLRKTGRTDVLSRHDEWLSQLREPPSPPYLLKKPTGSIKADRAPRKERKVRQDLGQDGRRGDEQDDEQNKEQADYSIKEVSAEDEIPQTLEELLKMSEWSGSK